jgi:hypothetical protein
VTHSFSNHLIDILQEVQDDAITIASINAEMVNTALSAGLEATPWHCARVGEPSITLKPRKPAIFSSDERKQPESHGRVLISVSFAGMDTKPDYQQFVDWIAQNVPENVADIRVEAVFGSRSSLYIISVPTEVWVMMPDDEAYSFVGHVTSNNLLHGSGQATAGTSGPQQPSSGRAGNAFGGTGIPFRPHDK